MLQRVSVLCLMPLLLFGRIHRQPWLPADAVPVSGWRVFVGREALRRPPRLYRRNRREELWYENEFF